MRPHSPAVVACLSLLLLGCVVGKGEGDEKGAMNALKSLPYVTWVTDRDGGRGGVTAHEAGRAQPGANLYASRNEAAARLVGMDGELLHQWCEGGDTRQGWHLVELLDGGDLLAVVSDRELVRFDRKCRRVWSLDGKFHHEVTATESGEILALMRGGRFVEVDGDRLPVLDDEVVLITADGEITERHSIYDFVHDLVPPSRFAAVREWLKAGWVSPQYLPEAVSQDTAPDILHTNSVVPLPAESGGRGNRVLLLSVREIDAAVVIDLDSGRRVWHWGPGEIDAQHDANALPGDRVLLFDNQGLGPKASRIVEVDRRTGEIVWTYVATPRSRFSSPIRGSVQRLANGNTLITESERGRAFEVEPDGSIVWEFLNPVTDDKRRRAAMVRVTRIDPAALDWLDAVDDAG